MGVIARRVASIPLRSATATWERVVELLVPDSGQQRQRLLAVRDIAATLILEEYTARAPIIVSPSAGDQARVYTLHGPDALGEQVSESPLATWPLTETGWTVSLPCDAADLPEMSARIAAHDGFSIRDTALGASLSEATAGYDSTPAKPGSGTGVDGLRIDLNEMHRP